MFRLSVALFTAYISCVASVNSVSIPKKNLLRLSRNLDEQDLDYSWLINYSLKFESCHTKEETVYDDGVGTIYMQKLVKFNMCSSEECGSNCKGGRYLVQLEDFVEAYANQKENDKQYACEQVNENCNCDNDDGDDCEDNCYSEAGLDYCIEGDDDAEAMDIRDYVECQEFMMDEEEDENDGDNEQELLYIGLKCSDNGQGVNLGIFTDDVCTVEREDSDSLSFPFKSESFVTDDCINCVSNDNDGGDDGDAYEISELCENNYLEAVKCEVDLDIYYPDNQGCDIIDNLMLGGSIYERRFKTVLATAIIFGLISIVLAAIALRLCCASKRDIMLNDADVHKHPSTNPGEQFNEDIPRSSSRFKFRNLSCFKTTLT